MNSKPEVPIHKNWWWYLKVSTGTNNIPFFHVFQFSSVAQSCSTLWDPMNCSTPGLPVHHQLLEFTQTHVHWVGDDIQPSHPLLSPSSPAPKPSSIRVFSNESTLHMVAKVLEFQLPVNIQDWSPRCPRDSQKSFPAPQFESINSSALSFLHSPTPTSTHDY